MISFYSVLTFLSLIYLCKCDEVVENVEIFNQAANAMNFSGKVVMVTGAGSGIGAETAQLFCYLGAQVVLVDIKAEWVQAMADQCRSVSPTNIKPYAIVGDLTKGNQVEFTIKKTIRNFGKIDVLVNSIGMMMFTPFTEQDYILNLRRLMEINLETTIHTIKVAVPHLRKTNGSIVSFSSAQQDKALVGSSAYQMSKASIVTLTRTLSRELGPLRINCVSPGMIPDQDEPDTPELQTYKEKDIAATPLGRSGTNLDVAKAVVFLSSPLAEWITGQNLVIDGGFHGDYAF